MGRDGAMRWPQNLHSEWEQDQEGTGRVVRLAPNGKPDGRLFDWTAVPLFWTVSPNEPAPNHPSLREIQFFRRRYTYQGLFIRTPALGIYRIVSLYALYNVYAISFFDHALVWEGYDGNFQCIV
jgi:hypothetical protein